MNQWRRAGTITRVAEDVWRVTGVTVSILAGLCLLAMFVGLAIVTFRG